MDQREWCQPADQFEARLAFERTIMKISTRFVKMTDEIDAMIQTSLMDLGLVTGASRAYIFEFHANGERMSNTFEWCAEGVAAQKESLKDLPCETFPWWMWKLKNNQIIHVDNVSTMPEEAKTEKDILESQSIKAVIVLPIHVFENVIGFVGLDDVTGGINWSEDEMFLLNLCADVFGNVFARKAYEKQLQMKNCELEKRVQEMQLLEAKLLQEERMASVGRLAAGLAHEINNPLSFLNANFDLFSTYLNQLRPVYSAVKAHVVERKNDPHAPHENKTKLMTLWDRGDVEFIVSELPVLLEESREGLDRIAEVVRTLQRFTEPGEFQSKDYVDLNDLIEEVVQLVSLESKGMVHIQTELEKVPPLYGERNAIGQALMGVLENAIYATAGSREEIFIRTKESSDCIHCTIQDFGTGMDIETMKRIYDPFYTTKEVGNGYGVGLSIAYNIIVNDHKGDILVESEKGRGSTFTIKLPKLR